MRYRDIAAALCLVIFFTSTRGGEVQSVAAVEEDVEVYWFFTCHEYEPLNHTPMWLSDYFEVTDPEVLLWLNITHVPGVNLTVLWYTPDNETHRVDTWEIPLSVETSPWYDEILEIPIDDTVRAKRGEWRADLYVDGDLRASHFFNFIDKSSEEWGYYAEILDLECPEKVRQENNFTVSVTMHYRFAAYTNLSLGLWDPVTEYAIIEKNMNVSGEETITLSLEVTAPEEPGNYTIDAAVFYQYADEWFIDENGFTRFWVVVEKTNPLLGGQAITVLVLLLIIVGYWFMRKGLRPRIVRE